MDDLIERARDAAAYSRKFGPSTNAPLLDALAAALEAAQEDAERYRWLRDCDDGNIAAFYIDAAGVPDPASMLAGRQLDVDIDAARKEAHAERMTDQARGDRR